jgi:hypothetical protein
VVIAVGFNLVGTAPVDASIISALAALTRDAVGGFTNVFANWLSRGSLLQHEKNRRQILYPDFIDEASKCYINAFQPGEADISSLVGLYAKLSRMRLSATYSGFDLSSQMRRKAPQYESVADPSKLRVVLLPSPTAS